MEYIICVLAPLFSLLFSRKIKNIVLRNLSVATINLVASYILYWTPYWENNSDGAEYSAFAFAGIVICYFYLLLICLAYYLTYKLIIWWIYKAKQC